jgi:hypothetical protein
MDVERNLRQLAKQMKYRLLTESKMPFFANQSNYSDLQMRFLSYIYFYQSLFTDIALGDVDDIVITDDIYEDAYSYYKSKVKNKDNKNLNMYKPQKDTTTQTTGSQWVFKSPKRKK